MTVNKFINKQVTKSIQMEANYLLWDRNQNTQPFDSRLTLTSKWLTLRWPWWTYQYHYWSQQKNLVLNSQHNQFYQSDLDLYPMTLVLKLGLDIIKMSHPTENEVSISRHSKVIACTPQTHRQHEDITFPHMSVKHLCLCLCFHSQRLRLCWQIFL